MDRRDREEFEIARLKSGQRTAPTGGREPLILESGNLGRSERVASGLLGQPSEFERIIQIKGQDDKARMISVALHAETVTGIFPGATNVRAAARLTFGVAGLQAVAELDIPMGATIPGFTSGPTGGQILTVPASFLMLDARNESINAPGLEMNVGGFVSYEPLGASRPPQRTKYIDAVAIPGGLSVTVPVPRFATAFRFFRTPGNPVTIQGFNDNAVTQLDEFSLAAGEPCPEIGIPADIQGYRFQNDGAVDVDHARFVFYLSM